jgi:four helix bundle protein
MMLTAETAATFGRMLADASSRSRMPKPLGFRDLDVWKRSMDLVVDVYRLTQEFPRSELYGLTGQTRRAASSVPANIAEGNGRLYRKEYAHHVSIARGSIAELSTCLEVPQRLYRLSTEVR